MTTDTSEPQRQIELKGCFNFRDLGGYGAAGGAVTRWGRLYRADGLARLEEADCARLADLALATVVDLRTETEVEEVGRFPGHYLEVVYHHLPLADVLPRSTELERYGDPEYVTVRYRELFVSGANQMAKVVDLLAEDGCLPAVFHCSAGKDRTGVLAAVILGMLGVEREEIVADYALSAKAMERLFERLKKDHADAAEEVDKYAPAVRNAHPEAIDGLISWIEERHGGFEGLARDWGVERSVQRLREHLLVEG